MIRVICLDTPRHDSVTGTEASVFCYTLDENHSLCLCTEEDEYAFELLNMQQLL